MPLTIHKRAWLFPLALLGLSIGCARQPDFAATQSSLPERTLPFHPTVVTAKRPLEPSFSLADVPPGTPILVHLQTPLSSSLSHPGESFKAILDEAIVVNGQTIARMGTQVTGKILQAKASDPAREAGYLRLSLIAITVEGQPWPLQTSSIFLKGAAYDREVPVPPVQLVGASTTISRQVPSASARIIVREDAAVSADRLLTFRLSQPIAGEHGGQ